MLLTAGAALYGDGVAARPAFARCEELPNLGDQFTAQANQRLVERPGIRGLGDIIVGAEGERFESGRRAACGQRTEHDGAQAADGACESGEVR